jgi:hypothetical protein
VGAHVRAKGDAITGINRADSASVKSQFVSAPLWRQTTLDNAGRIPTGGIAGVTRSCEMSSRGNAKGTDTRIDCGLFPIKVH